MQQGKAWIDNTRQCTMRAMIEFYNDTHVNCKDVEAAMHEAYGKCSKDNGICNAGMVMDNKESLLEIHTFRYDVRTNKITLLLKKKQIWMSGKTSTM